MTATHFTTAPAAYDYGWTTDLGPGTHDLYGDGTKMLAGRLVHIDTERRDYQLGRYGSGLYLTVEV